VNSIYAGSLAGEIIDLDQNSVIQHLDSEIVQLQHRKSRIMASTLTKTVVFPTLVPTELKQIGSKPRKDTRHGGWVDSTLTYAVRPNNKIFVYDNL
jgi:hypothetical protein